MERTGEKEPERPERLRHILRAFEFGGLALRGPEFISSDALADEYQNLHPEEETPGAKAADRCLRSFAGLADREVFETRPGSGRRPRPEALGDLTWMIPMLGRYLNLIGAAPAPTALAGLVQAHGAGSLYLLSVLRAARDQSRPLRFSYMRPGEASPRPRRLRVLDIALRGDRVLAGGRDLETGEFRQFLLLRMSGPLSLEEPTAREDPGEFLRQYDHSLAVFAGGPVCEARIRFVPEIGRDVEHEFFHASQSIEWRADGLILTLRVNNRFELFTLISRYMGNAELLSPADWRAEYAQRLRRALDLHGAGS